MRELELLIPTLFGLEGLQSLKTGGGQCAVSHIPMFHQAVDRPVNGTQRHSGDACQLPLGQLLGASFHGG